MDTVINKLIEKAKEEHKEIYPCMGKSVLEDCFTEEDGSLIFWFNTDDQKTHNLSEKIDQ